MKEYIDVLLKYALFHGRSARREYWMFQLVHFVFILLGEMILAAFTYFGAFPGMIIKTLVALYVLAMVIPHIAVTVRRLHDTGRSGLWLAAPLSPYVVAMVMHFKAHTEGQPPGALFYAMTGIFAMISLGILTFTMTDSTPGENSYGPNPKEIQSLST